MKNKIKWLGIIALVALIGFSMTACSSNSDGDSSDSGGKTTITVTGIPSKYTKSLISISGDGGYYSPVYEDLIQLGNDPRIPITNGSVTFIMQSQSGSDFSFRAGSYKVRLYLGDDKYGIEHGDYVECVIASKKINTGNNTIPYSEFEDI